MSEMNSWLAGLYGTGMTEQEKTAAVEEQRKLENLEVFCKVAAANGIDFSEMSEEAIFDLYQNTVAKTAAEGEGPPFPPKKKEKEEDKEEEEEEGKEAAAKAYLQREAEFQEKLAEADLMGRVMAHSMTQEREHILREQEKQASSTRQPAQQRRDVDEKTAAALAFEETSACRAIEMAKEAGFNEEIVAQRVSARYTLGDLPQSEKIAGITDLSTAAEIRGLEYLESIGVEVNWDKLGS